MKKLTTLLLSVCMFAVSNAADLTTVQSGLWSDAATWGGSVPSATDNVIITDFTVDVLGDASCANLTFGTATTLKDSCLVMGENATLTVRGLLGLTATPFIPTTDVSLMRGSHATSTLKLTGEALTGAEPLMMIADNVIKFVRPKNLIVAPADIRSYKAGSTQGNTFDLRGGKTVIKSGAVFEFGTRTAIGLVDDLNLLTIESGAVVKSKILEGEFSGKKMPAAKMIVDGSLTASGQTTIRHIQMGENGIFKTSSGSTVVDWQIAWDGWWHSTVPNDVTLMVTGDAPTPVKFTLVAGSTIEFNRTSSQNIPGLIPANKVFKIWTNAVETSTYYTTDTVPAYNVQYATIKVSGSGTKTIQSNLVTTGNITIDAGTLALPAGKVLVMGGVVGGVVGDAGFTKAGAIINLTSADATKGAVTATINAANVVTLVASPKAGFQLANYTEGGAPLASATFTPVDGSTRSIVANWTVATSINSINAEAYVTVVGSDLKLNGNIKAIEVFDIQGRRLLSQVNVTRVNVKNKGIYIVKLYTAQAVVNQKISIN